MEYYIVLDYLLVNIVRGLCYKLLYLFVAVKNWLLYTLYDSWAAQWSARCTRGRRFKSRGKTFKYLAQLQERSLTQNE